MSVAQIRKELHQFIDRADNRILNLIYGMMKADNNEETDLPEEHKKILDERLKAHIENRTEGSSWQEVKDRIKK